MQPISLESVARVCHEANRAWCAAHGDDSQLPWDQAPEWQRQSAINGVRHVVSNPTTTPEMQHLAWMRDKMDDGWVYGPDKDPTAKTHPCITAYDKLPEMQRRKDELFIAVAKSLAL